MQDHPSVTAPLYDRINGHSVEVFYCDDELARAFGSKPGWHWWGCWEGRLPDSDPIGPFGSAYLAFKDATLAQCVGAMGGLHPGPFGRRAVPPVNKTAAR